MLKKRCPEVSRHLIFCSGLQSTSVRPSRPGARVDADTSVVAPLWEPTTSKRQNNGEHKTCDRDYLSTGKLFIEGTTKTCLWFSSRPVSLRSDGTRKEEYEGDLCKSPVHERVSCVSNLPSYTDDPEPRETGGSFPDPETSSSSWTDNVSFWRSQLPGGLVGNLYLGFDRWRTKRNYGTGLRTLGRF